jgi:type II secretory pathway predicted ATPase ExeA
MEEIARVSRGIPRVINHLCSNLLLFGYIQEEDPILPESVLHVAEELGLG